MNLGCKTNSAGAEAPTKNLDVGTKSLMQICGMGLERTEHHRYNCYFNSVLAKLDIQADRDCQKWIYTPPTLCALKVCTSGLLLDLPTKSRHFIAAVHQSCRWFLGKVDINITGQKWINQSFTLCYCVAHRGNTN